MKIEESHQFQKAAKKQLEIFKEKKEECEKLEELLKKEITTSEGLKKIIEEKETKISEMEQNFKEKLTENQELKTSVENLKNKAAAVSNRQTLNLDSFILTQTSKNFTYSLVTQKDKHGVEENKICSVSFLFLLLNQIYEKIKNMTETVVKNFRNSRERNLKKLKNAIENLKNFEKMGKLKEISHENLIEYHENILTCVNLVRLIEVKTPVKMVNHSCETDILPSPNSFYIGDFTSRRINKLQKSITMKDNDDISKISEIPRKSKSSKGFVDVEIDVDDFKFCESRDANRGRNVEINPSFGETEDRKTENTPKIDSFLQEENEKIMTKDSNETTSWVNHNQFNQFDTLETPFQVQFSNKRSPDSNINLGFNSPESRFGGITDDKNSRNLMIRSGSTSYFLEEESESKMKEYDREKNLLKGKGLWEIKEFLLRKIKL